MKNKKLALFVVLLRCTGSIQADPRATRFGQMQMVAQEKFGAAQAATKKSFQAAKHRFGRFLRKVRKAAAEERVPMTKKEILQVLKNTDTQLGLHKKGTYTIEGVRNTLAQQNRILEFFMSNYEEGDPQSMFRAMDILHQATKAAAQRFSAHRVSIALSSETEEAINLAKSVLAVGPDLPDRYMIDALEKQEKILRLLAIKPAEYDIIDTESMRNAIMLNNLALVLEQSIARKRLPKPRIPTQPKPQRVRRRGRKPQAPGGPKPMRVTN